MNTCEITKPFRDLGLMHLLDKAKYAVQKWKNGARNETKAEVLEHIPGGTKSWGLEQDVWILKKK